MGAESVLVIPGDAPLITGEDLDFVLGKGKEGQVRDPRAFRRRTRHKRPYSESRPTAYPRCSGTTVSENTGREAERRYVPCDIYKNFNISIDIDEPEDIETFSLHGSHTKTYGKLLNSDSSGKKRRKTVRPPADSGKNRDHGDFPLKPSALKHPASPEERTHRNGKRKRKKPTGQTYPLNSLLHPKDPDERP